MLKPYKQWDKQLISIAETCWNPRSNGISGMFTTYQLVVYDFPTIHPMCWDSWDFMTNLNGDLMSFLSRGQHLQKKPMVSLALLVFCADAESMPRNLHPKEPSRAKEWRTFRCERGVGPLSYYTNSKNTEYTNNMWINFPFYM